MLNSVTTQRMEDIATWMDRPTSEGFPQVLKGIFFMDGNPLPDDCLTLQNLEWNAKTSCLTVPVAAPLQWTFHRSILGWLLLFGAWLTRFRYDIQFEDDSLIQAQIIPIFLGISVPKWIVSATMCQDESTDKGDIWQRKNVWLGGVPHIGEYVMRRVVDADGQQTENFQAMLKKVDEECLVVSQ